MFSALALRFLSFDASSYVPLLYTFTMVYN